MIDSIGGRAAGKQVLCDICMDGFEADSFEDAVQHMKDEGWIKRKKDGSWHHYCPECQQLGVIK